jgi:hypothetical protein
LAAQFLAVWGIYALDPCFVSIAEEHLPAKMISGRLQPASLKHTMIGFPFVKNQKEVTLQDSGFADNLTDRKKIKNSEALIRIALFDLWMANDDRNWNNYNMLIESKKDGFYFIPIDHETIFNSNSLFYGLNIQTEDDSLIHTPLFKSIVSKKLINNIFQQERKIREDFYLCTANCKNELDKILEELPHDWNISINTKRDLILKHLFSSEWSDDVFRNFLIYLKQLL